MRSLSQSSRLKEQAHRFASAGKSPLHTLTIASLLGLAPIRVCADASTANENEILWYRRPATKWEEALPIGNGRLGAMVFGGPFSERFKLNTTSFGAAPPYPEAKPGAAVIT